MVKKIMDLGSIIDRLRREYEETLKSKGVRLVKIRDFLSTYAGSHDYLTLNHKVPVDKDPPDIDSARVLESFNRLYPQHSIPQEILEVLYYVARGYHKEMSLSVRLYSHRVLHQIQLGPYLREDVGSRKVVGVIKGLRLAPEYVAKLIKKENEAPRLLPRKVTIHTGCRYVMEVPVNVTMIRECADVVGLFPYYVIHLPIDPVVKVEGAEGGHIEFLGAAFILHEEVK